MLRVHELTRRFGSLVALDAVSFEISRGSIHGLIGPNGSGKTTLFNLVTGFLAPSGGKVLWQDKDITRARPYVVSRLGIARTFQNTSNYGNLTVRENLVLASRNANRTTWLARMLHLPSARAEEAEQGRIAEALLGRFELHEFADVRAGDLPGGTQKILGVGIALSTGPSLLMLDEPLAGLNPGEKVRVMNILQDIRRNGPTILIIEHDMKAIMQTCDRITVLCYGKLLAEGTAEEISRDPLTIQAYLGEEAA